MPLIETKGAASAQGFGEFATSSEKLYIESCFSTYLYTGNGSTQTITNGIDLSGKGGLVWVKCRSIARDNILGDSERIGTNGGTRRLISNSTAAQSSTSITTFFLNSSGFQTNGGDQDYNGSGETYASWTFRKQAKFFDVVTWTGTTGARTLTHNLGSTPGVIIVKSTTNSAFWCVYHSALGPTKYLQLSTTDAAATQSTIWNDTAPTSTQFTVGSYLNQAQTYVAYLFAHDAGGFGLSGTDNVISCGSYTGNGSATGPSVTLGWEPQWLLVKNATTAGREWFLMDNMRGFTANGTDAMLFPNNSNSESSQTKVGPTATGFQPLSASGDVNASGDTYIYIAIRRGPMKVPTSGTSVFKPFTYNNSAGGFTQTQNAGFPTDFALESDRINPANHYLVSRLQGPRAQMASNSTLDEASYNTGVDQQKFDLQNLFAQQNSIDTSVLLYCFRRAPGFFDVVCYTGTGVARTINHNLAAVPELMIVRRRSSIANWAVNSQSLTASDYLYLNSTDPKADNTSPIIWNSTRPTSTVFSVGTSHLTNENTQRFVAYLFATVAGVSKVFSFTGNGSSQTINCGFTGGARFVMIKRIDSTGDWYVWDSARGIVASNDPHLSLNTTAAEVTTDDSVDADSTGFVVNQNSATNVNVNGATYIGLAVA